MRRLLALVTAVGLIVVACAGGDEGGADRPAESTPPDTTAAVDPTVAAPALAFEDVELEPGFVAGIPVGWVPDDMFETKFQPEDSAAFDGFKPTYWVTQQCLGACETKTAAQWSDAVVQSFLFTSLQTAEGRRVVREDLGEDFAVIEARVGWVEEGAFVESEWTDVNIARWGDAQERIIVCQLTVHDNHTGLKDALEQACMSIASTVLP